MSMLPRMTIATLSALFFSLMFAGTAAAQPWGYYPGYRPFGPPVYAYPPVFAPPPVFVPRVVAPPVVVAPAYAYPQPAFVAPAPVVYSRGVVPYNYVGPRGRLRVGYAPAVYGIGY